MGSEQDEAGVVAPTEPKLSRAERMKQAKKLKKKKKKERRKQRKEEKAEFEKRVEEVEEVEEDEEGVEVEYVSAKHVDEDDPAYAELAKVFEAFAPPEELTKEPESESEPAAATKTTTHRTDAEKEMEALEKELEGGEGEESEPEEGEKKLSNRQRRKMNRLSVAELKQLVERPELVEVWDVTSADPRLLVYLKSCKNSVAVPRHWCRKRKYLQGKRGVEKPPWQLPDFIAETGIAKIRGAYEEAEEKKSAKGKSRDRVRPKMGKIDIDYQVLHDAFFKYQTKPRLSVHGELYYEGKEFEGRMKSMRPGLLTEELREALSMVEGAPPPWLINMQRYGPPPSYPQMKIPGVNAPIPLGASYGYHPGGWGKPPVDEYGHPLYGDVFGQMSEDQRRKDDDTELKNARMWGEMEAEEEDSSDEEDEDEGAEGEDSAPLPDEDGGEHAQDMGGTETEMTGFATATTGGFSTPGEVDLRKRAGEDTDERGPQRPLYQVLEQTDNRVGGSQLMGSAYTYQLPPDDKDQREKEKRAKGDAVNLYKSQRTDEVAVTLDPGELEDLDASTLRQKYEAQVQLEKGGRQGPAAGGNMAEMVMEQARKRKRESEKHAESKRAGHESFKF